MTLYGEYLKTAIPDPYTVLGVRLKPFSLGHKLVLGRINSPFEIGGIAGISDIVLATLICSQDYTGAVALLDDPDLAKLCEDWAYKVSVVGKWPFRKIQEINWKEKRTLLESYFTAHSQCPVYSVDERNFSGALQACPLVQSVKVFLMAELSMSESEIMNRSWGLCLWDYITLKASRNELTMVDKHAEAELIAKAKAAA